MAETREETLRRFFQEYARASLEGNTEAIAEAYAPTYIETSPDTFAAWKVDEHYRQALAERFSVMREHLGLEGLEAEVASVREVAPLHYLAQVHWKMTFARAKAGHVTSAFDITYIVKIAGEPRILAYISHESQEAVMRRDGII